MTRKISFESRKVERSSRIYKLKDEIHPWNCFIKSMREMSL